VGAIHCEIVDEMLAGDHVVFVARPERLSTAEHIEPLIFYRSVYRASPTARRSRERHLEIHLGLSMATSLPRREST
jgi:flavin reductase (DIM6/NTAB) family NADH-FMN oxidoreductase RutF